MTKGRIISFIVLGVVLTIVFYDVQFVFDIEGSTEARIPDPKVEEEYAACFLEKDDAIHVTAFGTIDNPDVQKLYISSNREKAVAECRALHPETQVTVAEPARFNLVDLTPRFW